MLQLICYFESFNFYFLFNMGKISELSWVYLPKPLMRLNKLGCVRTRVICSRAQHLHVHPGLPQVPCAGVRQHWGWLEHESTETVELCG